MRAIRVFEHVSLDGVIQVSDGDGGFPYGEWTAPYRTPVGRDALLAIQGTSFDLLLGRRTYDMWSAFWPTAPASQMANALNAATKYVATHRPESLAWGPSEPFGGDVAGGVRRIAESDGPDLLLWGSSTLTSILFEHDLVTEIVLIVYPVLLGVGKRFFGIGTPARALELVGVDAMPSGATINRYRVAGRLAARAPD